MLAVVIAGATIWLLLTDPVTVAESVDSGEVSPLVQSLAARIFEALRGLLKYSVGRVDVVRLSQSRLVVRAVLRRSASAVATHLTQLQSENWLVARAR